MMNNVIKLELDKSVPNLSGNKYGRKVYDDQVKNNLSWDIINEIHLPDYITEIAYSFIEGFYTEMLGEKKVEEILEKVQVKSTNEEIEKKIISRISRKDWF